ncbi:MAG: hypothetical protein GY757_04590 [bacterium]|nr:hypothetical protein [bacterium]
MKNKLIFLLLFFIAAGALLANDNPWGDLKKIHYYDSQKNYTRVLENLNQISTESLSKIEMDELAVNLIKFGDYYLSKGVYDNANAFYEKVISFSPKYWYLYNKLEKIQREKGSFIPGFKNTFKQLGDLLKSFGSSFLLVNNMLNVLFFTSLLVFFIFSMLLFIRYFKLAGNDLLHSEKGSVSTKKLVIVSLVLLWPLFFLSGWMLYPFIISGFLWVYINENEKSTIILLIALVGVGTLLLSLNLVLEDSAGSKEFRVVRDVYQGHLFESDDYEKFDNNLKVTQAYAYYLDKQYDTALEILDSTGKDYMNKLKHDLTGNIYFKSEDYAESQAAFIEALRVDEKDPVSLNNFTLALLKVDKPNINKPTVFRLHTRRYPEIESYKATISHLMEVEPIPESILWKRVFSLSKEKFSFGEFLKQVSVQLIQLPVIYYILIFIGYIFAVAKMFPEAGKSTFCSKCSKIIKEAAVHKSYKLCDECYQLFLIKDVIFLEAKIIKEKELTKKFEKKYLNCLLFSIVIPGLNLNLNEKNRIFVLLTMLFYFLLGFSIIGVIIFTKVFPAAPIILNLVGILAFVFYFLFNLFSIMGDYDGF